MVCRHYLVSGLVQGVGFRNFVYMAANALDVVGKVRNLKDGRVEAIALGEASDLEELEKAMARGPAHSKVERLDKVTVPEKEITSLINSSERAEFRVVSDGGEPWSFKA